MSDKIALITFGFTGSLFPLARTLQKKGYEIDIYILNYIGFDDLEAFDCKYASKRFGVEEVPTQYWKSMSEYFVNSEKVHLFSIRMPRPYVKVPILRNIIEIVSLRYSSQISDYINHKKYRVINFIGAYFSQNYLTIIKKLNSRVVFSLHEVCNHSKPNYSKPTKLLKYLLENKIDIIVYSDNSLKHIRNYKNICFNKIERINFGLFETYSTIPQTNTLTLPENFILFYGSILPYKGLSILYQAFSSLSNKNIYLVVAGKGYDDCLKNIQNDNRCILINRRLSNSELCELIRKCRFVVCPYLTMSQSGIPQTVYPFHKPIIASDLDGFREIINSGKNGLLFKKCNVSELANCMTALVENEDLYNNLVKSVQTFEHDYREYSWDYISEKFIDCYLR